MTLHTLAAIAVVVFVVGILVSFVVPVKDWPKGVAWTITAVGVVLVLLWMMLRQRLAPKPVPVVRDPIAPTREAAATERAEAAARAEAAVEDPDPDQGWAALLEERRRLDET